MKKNLLLAFIAVFSTMLVGCTNDKFEGVISLSKEELVFEALEVTAQEVVVTSNVDWMVTFDNEADKQWVTVTPDNGVNETSVKITVKNNSGDARVASITIGDGVTSAVLKVSQNAETFNIIDFEDVELDPIKNMSFGTFHSDISGSLSKKYEYSNLEATFNAYYGGTEAYSFWTGVAYSSNTDKETPGMINEYSVYYKDQESGNGGVNGSEKFAVMYYMNFYPDFTPALSFAEGATKTVDHLYVNNSTFAALTVLNGEGMSRKFVDGDWFMVTMTGYDIAGVKTKSKDFYLADYRDGKTDIVNDWTKVSLLELGEVNKVLFTFSSSDTNEYGMLTPAYMCVDNIALKK